MKKEDLKNFVNTVKKSIAKNRKKYKTFHHNIKCDCTHRQKDHYSETGWCKKCSCTWFYPNVKYIQRNKIEKISK
jgi:hypothetical protein